MTHPCVILIVDDEKDLLEMYQDFFELENFKVYAAPSASLGLELLDAHADIQVIISDSHMNGMSGLEFLQKVSLRPVRPLFYLATGDLAQSVDAITSLGGTGLVAKPFDMNEVIKRILKDLNGKL